MKDAAERFAALLEELADLLELQGESWFKIRAYRVGARSVREAGERFETEARSEALDARPGIGAAIAEKAREWLDSGHLRTLDRERAAVPSAVVALWRQSGLPGGFVGRLWRSCGVTDADSLRRAWESGALDGLRPGDRQRLAALLGPRGPRSNGP